jgi:hypothetical protein
MAVVEGVTASADLEVIGSPILPGGTEAQIRRMINGNLYIADVGRHGLVACSPHWIVPAATVAPVMAAAGLPVEPGSYQVYATGRAKEPKVHVIGGEPPEIMIGRHLDNALAATEPVYHVTHRGLPLVAASWDYTHGEEGWAYVTDMDGAGLRTVYLDWLTGKAVPEDRAEMCKLRVDAGLYRLRTDGDASRPVAVWLEQYLNARYLSHDSKRTVARRSLYVLVPVRFPANG